MHLHNGTAAATATAAVSGNTLRFAYDTAVIFHGSVHPAATAAAIDLVDHLALNDNYADAAELADRAYMGAALATQHLWAKSHVLRAQLYRQRARDAMNNGGGGLEDAAAMLRMAHWLLTLTCGAMHPHTAAAAHDLGKCLMCMGHAADAVPIMRSFHSSQMLHHGQLHPSTVKATVGLGKCLVLTTGLAENKEADDLLRWSVQATTTASESAPGAADMRALRASALVWLGRCMYDRNEVEAALPVAREGHSAWSIAMGSTHPETAHASILMGYCMVALGMLSEGVEKLVSGVSVLLGLDHVDACTADYVTRACKKLGCCLMDQGMHADADKWLRHAYTRMVNAYQTRTHDEPAHVAMLVGMCCFVRGRDIEARRLFHHTLRVFDVLHGPNHPTAAMCSSLLARCDSSQHVESREGHDSDCRDQKNLACSACSASLPNMHANMMSLRVDSFRRAAPQVLSSFGIDIDDPRPIAFGRHRTLRRFSDTYAYLDVLDWRPDVNDAFVKTALVSGKRMVLLLEGDSIPGTTTFPRSCELAVEISQLLDAGCKFYMTEAQPHADAGVVELHVSASADADADADSCHVAGKDVTHVIAAEIAY